MNEIDELTKVYEQKTSKRRIDYFYVLLFLVTIIIIFFNFIYPRFIYAKVVVDGDSMLPTIVGAHKDIATQEYAELKDIVGCSRTKKIQRGDIVVFTPPSESGSSKELYIKRVIAIEGDTVSFFIEGKYCYLMVKDSQNKVIIDGYEYEEPYIKEKMENTKRGKTTIVKKGEFYAMGDNRNNSSDSRVLGAFKISSIYGVAKNVYREKWSIKIGSYKLFNSYNKIGTIKNPLKGDVK